MTKKERNKILLRLLTNLDLNLSPIDNVLQACNRQLFKTYVIASWIGMIRTRAEKNDYLITWDDYRNIICLAMVLDEKDLD